MTIQLRPLKLSDAEQISKQGNDYHIWMNLTDAFPHPYSKQDAINFYKLQKEKLIQDVFAITLEKDLIGIISFSQKNGIYHISAEIGYWIGKEYWGKGYATEACKQIIKICFDSKPEIVKIYAMTYSHNIGSERVLLKSGFQKEATLTKACIKAWQILDLNYFSIFRA